MNKVELKGEKHVISSDQRQTTSPKMCRKYFEQKYFWIGIRMGKEDDPKILILNSDKVMISHS